MSKKTPVLGVAPVDQGEAIRMPTSVLFDRMHNEYPDLHSWLNSLGRFGANPVDAFVITAEDTGWRIRMFTERHQYCVTARPPVHEYRGYLGCIASCRAPLAGETWTRGRDLPDGPWSEATWNKILRDIVAYELVRLGK